MQLKELPEILANARRRFDEIKSRYPQLKVELVFATRFGMESVKESPVTLLLKIRDFFLDSAEKTLLLELCARKKRLDEAGDSKASGKISATIEEHISTLKLNPDVQVELRWIEIDYDLNRTLRSDAELVDVRLTPQIAGIRIVLGTLGDFSFSWE